MIEYLREKCIICDLYAQQLQRAKHMPKSKFQDWPRYSILRQPLGDGTVQFKYNDPKYAEIMQWHGVVPSYETAKDFNHIVSAHCLEPHEDEPGFDFGEAVEGAPVKA